MCSPILLRPSPQEIVLGRLRGRIRRLFFVGAIVRVENGGRICCLFFVGAVVRVENGGGFCRLFFVGAVVRVEMRRFSGEVTAKSKKFVPKILFLESLRRTKNSVRGTTQIVLQNQHHSGSHEALDH